MPISRPSPTERERQVLKSLFLSGMTGILFCFGVMTAQAPAQNLADPTRNGSTFWQTFHHGSIMANGVRLHYVEGGSGAPLLLIPGWPESW